MRISSAILELQWRGGESVVEGLLFWTVAFASYSASRDNGLRDHKSHFVEEIQEQWQHDDFFGPRGYSNEMDIAPERWGIGPGESDGFQETEELFLAASQIFESVDESSEPQVDELFKVASQQIELEDWFAEPVSSK